MSEKELQRIADTADFIVSGYAFTECEDTLEKIFTRNSFRQKPNAENKP